MINEFFFEKENINRFNGQDHSTIPVAAEVSLYHCSVLFSADGQAGEGHFLVLCVDVSDETEQVSLQVSSERTGFGIRVHLLETSWKRDDGWQGS